VIVGLQEFIVLSFWAERALKESGKAILLIIELSVFALKTIDSGSAKSV
jgi:hypothetical protein